MTKYALIGFEYNNIWKAPTMYAEEINEQLNAADDIWDASKFETLKSAEEKRKYLQENYSDYRWYVIIIHE